MFQFTNTVILNSATDELSGKPKYTAHAATLTRPDAFEVKRVNTFLAYEAGKGGVTAIWKRNASRPLKPVSELKVTNWGPGIYQLNVEVRLSSYSMNSFYARATPHYKGMPMYFSFEILAADTPTQIAQKIEKVVKHIQVRYGSKWLNVTTVADVVTIEGIDEFQIFERVAIQKYEPLTNPCACNDVCNCDWIDQLVAYPADENGVFPDPDNTIVQGRLGFGTYEEITRNLRLPTAANTNWIAVNMDERAVPGALYDQYTIQYVKPRGIQGTDAVGDLVISSTDHVFLVRQDLVLDWETALANVAAATADGGITVIDGPGTYPLPTPKVGL